MSWVTVTSDHVHSRLNSAEKTAFNAVLQVSGQSDPMTETIGLVTNLVRGFAQKQVSDPPASGLPPELVDPAVDLIIYRLAQRVSNAHAEQRKPAADAAMEILKAVAGGDFIISDDEGGTGGTDGAYGSETKIQMRTSRTAQE